MAESIFNRISRILSATVEDSVDRLERAGGEAVMREAIREADRAVDQVEAEREAAVARRLQAMRHGDLIAKRIAGLADKARFAVARNRDDLAEAALSQQLDFEAQAEALVEAEAGARDEEAQLAEGLAALGARKAQMEDALAAHLLAKREASRGVEPPRAEASAAGRVDAAERAFERAMAGAGGGGLPRAEAGTIRRVAEIDALHRSAALAERRAALKSGRAA